MAAPTLLDPPHEETGLSGDKLTLSPPATGRVGFYIVRLDFPPGSDATDWTPIVSPALTRPRDTYDIRWPTSTAWEQPWFVLAVRGAIDLPILEWEWAGAGFDLGTVLAYEIEDCTFQLRTSNILDPADNNRSPAAQPGAFYSIRGATGVGRTDIDPSEEQVVSTDFPSNPIPGQAVLNGINATAFCAGVPTISSIGPPTVGADSMTTVANLWTPNYALFFPDVWGSTLSIFAPSDAPDTTYGWHTGRIGWA